jgi:hypothetical protein
MEAICYKKSAYYNTAFFIFARRVLVMQQIKRLLMQNAATQMSGCWIRAVKLWAHMTRLL